VPPESPTLGFTRLQFEAMLTAARESPNQYDFALLGRAVRERRLALGLSQVELATRAGMTQPALSRLEAGGVIPTIPLLDRISTANKDADARVDARGTVMHASGWCA
jgi:DNA-binding XRE family transcriptional regulator